VSEHPEVGVLVSLRDGELSDAAAEHLRGHLASCGACSEVMESLRVRARGLPGALPPGPALDAAAMERARETVRARLEREPERGADEAISLSERRGRWSGAGDAPGWGWGDLARAAGLVLLLAGGAAALPGSPVRSWFAGSGEPNAGAEAEATVETLAPPATPSDETGVRIAVGPGPVVVEVMGLEAGARLRVERGPAGELAVFAPEGSRFDSSEGRVEVQARGGPVRVSLPSDGIGRVQADGTVLVRSDTQGLRAQAPVAERTDDAVVVVVPR